MSTDIAQIGVGVFAVLIAGYQIYVTVIVWRSDQHSTSQKWMQSVVIWFLPVVGAIVCHTVMRWNPKRRHPDPFAEPNAHTGDGSTTGAPPTVD
jgi:hypothetical protein